MRNFRQDPIPNIRTAGVNTGGRGESAASCLKPDIFYNEPSTPEHIKKYRKTFQNQPGIKQVHPGVFDDRLQVPENFSFGQKTQKGDHVDTVIKAQNIQGLAARFNDIKEQNYASQIREPLAKGYERGYQWPNQIQNKENFNFGVPTLSSENAKDVLYPKRNAQLNNWMEDDEAQQLYKKTHGNYNPGEQKERDYIWPVDKNKMRFGYAEEKVLNGAANAVHHERIDQGFPKTVIVKKTVEDMKAVSQDQLGKPRNLGQGRPPIPQDFVFGIRNLQNNDTWNAAKCLHGEQNYRQLQPDADLGKCTKLGTRNQVRKPEDTNRVFGCPTIRTDIPTREKRSVADYTNYGDEPEAIDLLFPQTFTEMGITEYDFQLPRGKEDIRVLFERIGFSYKVGKFNAMYNRAKQYMPYEVPSDYVSVRAFMMAVNEMHEQD
ncbi:UNKNOWN [Stylonychia lemnae]|uniref:EFHB C-terminal EF-hand domain-containing protein n=1 Tax=Stylonychia lemnae TaxID=5949 RepID=A0A078ASL9_STYLE|nr:UNKNOWN [Stylonychia lemnae]|eukprot:CDW85169.1 UNKNOWN [Stylonychia lemnae]